MNWLSTFAIKSACYAIVLLLIGWIIAKRLTAMAEKYTDVVKLKSQLQEIIKLRFDQAHIDIPYPQLTLRRTE